MEANGRNYFSPWKGLMVGSFLGAAAGFLLAPKSGKELRSEIKERTNRAFDETKQFCSESRTTFKDTMACLGRRKEKASVSHIESPDGIVADA
jgi:gas vesicle protein